MSFKIKGPLPYCPGCGHHLIVRGTVKAFNKLGWKPKDVILVTDIGCVGLADKYFPCHTVHGLHGRSVALGMGIRFGLRNSNKHIIIYIGDGGAGEGLQHLIEGARLNTDLTVVVHNNMVIAMTGGQSSVLTPAGYKTRTEPEGSVTGSYDLPQLVHQAGAFYSSRILAQGDISDDLADAFSHPGFSLVEVVEHCFSYGWKLNPRVKLEKVLEKMGRSTGTWINKKAVRYQPEFREKTTSLLNKVPAIKKEHQHSVSKPISILMGGSAGEGVQTAATVLAHAGMLAGLNATKKGEYPITVGTGYSIAEIILSPEQIQFTGITNPQVAIITSEDGLKKNKQKIENMKNGTLFIDETLSPPSTNAQLIAKAFRKTAGAKGAALCAATFWLNQSRFIPKEALIEAAEASKHPTALKKAAKSAKKL